MFILTDEAPPSYRPKAPLLIHRARIQQSSPFEFGLETGRCNMKSCTQWGLLSKAAQPGRQKKTRNIVHGYSLLQ